MTSEGEDIRAAELLATWHDAGLPTELHRAGHNAGLVQAIVGWIESGHSNPHALVACALREYASTTVTRPHQ